MELTLNTNYSTTIKLTRLIDKRLQAIALDFTIDLELDPEAAPDLQVNKLNLMKKWMDDILSNCVAFDINNSMNTEFLGELENHIMFCPDEPNDYLLLLLIVAKLNAIGDSVITVKSAGLVGDASQGFGYTLLGDPSEILVSDSEWMGTKRFYDRAWWNRSDGSMLDVPMLDTDDPDNKPDILIDLEQDTKTASDRVIADKVKNTDGAEIIKLHFKPTIVTND